MKSVPAFATARSFAPIFNTSNLKTTFGGEDGKTLPLKNKLLKELEMIAFPSTCFTVLRKCENNLVEVKTEEYPSTTPLFVDERFLQYHVEKPEERQKNLPSISSVLNTMSSFLGAPYLWGGNCLGVPEMINFYPPLADWNTLDHTSKHTWKLEGVDCSGIIYYATNGFTPRNTSSLVHFGKGVAVEGKDLCKGLLLPGDLIVWKGHVIVVLDTNTVIESCGDKGVVLTPLSKKIEEIQNQIGRIPLDDWNAKNDIPEDKRYVIRRWHPDYF